METYREYWQLFVKGYGRLPMALFICVLTITVSLLEGINIALLVPLLENMGSKDPEQVHWVTRVLAGVFDAMGLPFGLGAILLLLGTFMLSMAVTKYVRLLLVGKITESFTAWLRKDLMWKLLHTDMSYFHRQRLGVMTDTLTTQANRAGDSLSAFFDIVTNLGVITAYLLAAAVIAPVLAAVALGMIILVALLLQHYIAKARSIGTAQVTRENDFQVVALESLSGIHVIKSFLLEQIRWVDFGRKAEDVRESYYLLHKNRSQVQILQETALFALIGGIVFVGVSILDLGMAVVVALLFILFRLTPRITGFNNSRQSLAVSLAILHKVKVIVDDISTPQIVNGDQPFDGLQQGIQLDGVHFSYNGSGEVLKNTSFTIPKGKMTAIAGSSGSGKSTLIDLLLRYYDPSRGSILIDGADLRRLDLSSWRGSIGLVTQDIFLFNDTVTNNIAVGRLGQGIDSVIEAAKQAYAHEFIEQLPQGYETKIGDRGWNLSGGERQRIALARAILMKPEILILDEATSALDSESEELIQNYINKIRGTCTLVVVAHRMSTIQSADKIVVLQDGRIVEEGDWDSLLAASGVFANYQRLQSGVV